MTFSGLVAKKTYFPVLSIVFAIVCLVNIAEAQQSVPTAFAVPLAESQVQPGFLVVFDETAEVYRYSEPGEVVDVYGVVHVRPPLYLETATATVPVVTDGVARVAVADSNGSIARGDLLRIGEGTGIAERASTEDDRVFAVALEAWIGEGDQLVLADVSVTRATALRDVRAIEDDPSLVEEEGLTAGAIAATTARIVVALGIAVGSLAFILYTYRSIWVTGVTAVGRNPRARGAVLFMNITSSILILLLAVLVIIVALGVLVVSV